MGKLWDKQKQILNDTIVNAAKDYQILGIEHFLRKRKCLNSDDMGLGKTFQVLAAINKRALIICPTSLKENWANEVRKWRPDLKPIVLKEKICGIKNPIDGEVVITSEKILPEELIAPPYSCGYKVQDKSKEAKLAREELKKEKKFYKTLQKHLAQAYQYTTLVIDEAHAFSMDSQRSSKISTLSHACGRVWVLTGTPIPAGKMYRFFSMLKATDLLHPHFKDERDFAILAGLKWDNVKRCYVQGRPPSKAFRSRIKDIMIRRKKEEVLKELPPKTISFVEVPIYNKEINKELAALKETYGDDLFNKNELPPFEAFSHVRSAIAKARQKSLLEMVQIYESNDTPLIVFSANRKGLECLIGRKGWAYIDGQTPDKEVEYIKANQDKYKGLALTIVANHAGHNLTHFSNMLYVDLHWDCTINAQSFDRCHRIGQVNPVDIKIMISDDALDKRIAWKLSSAEKVIKEAIG